MNFLKSKKIITQVHYIPITEHPFYSKKNYKTKKFPESIKYYNEALSLPIYYSLTKKQQIYVIKKLFEFLN